MSTLPVKPEPLAVSVSFPEDTETLVVELADGRQISVPLAWFPRLAGATREQRADYHLIGEGIGIHWPQIDEDLSVAGFLRQ
jgi:uncharacterized protein DUF2442